MKWILCLVFFCVYFKLKHQNLKCKHIHFSYIFFDYRIVASDAVEKLFSIDRHSGQLFIRDASALDVNHLKAENVFFSVEVGHICIFVVFSTTKMWKIE